jgi:hypothetical protein
MALWTAISNALVAVGAKPFATTIQALRDNIIALGEGASGAPRVEGRALDTYLGSIDIVNTTAQGFLDLDRHETLVMFGSGQVNSAVTLQVRFSNDNGATYGSFQNLGAFTTTAIVYSCIMLNLRTGVFDIQRDIRPRQTGTLTVPSDCNAVQFRCSGTGSVSLSVFCLGGLTA